MKEFLPRLRAYLSARHLRGPEHLAALVNALGVEAVARDSGLPTAALRALVRRHAPPGGFLVVAPGRFALGLAPASAVSRAGGGGGRRAGGVARLRPRIRTGALPPDHRLPLPAVTAETDQGAIGSCVAWAAAHAAEWTLGSARGEPGLRLNPSSIYAIIKDQHLDPFPTEHGSTLEAGAAALEGFGALRWEEMAVHRDAPEGNPGYLPPPADLYARAVRHRCAPAAWIDAWTAATLDEARALLHGDWAGGQGLAICTGCAVFRSWFNAVTQRDGFVPAPLAGEEPIGRHALSVGGWRTVDGELWLAAKNSWGFFGDQGWLYFHHEYVLQHFGPGFVVPAPAAVAAHRPALAAGGRAAAIAAGAAALAATAWLFAARPPPAAPGPDAAPPAAGSLHPRVAQVADPAPAEADPIAIYREIVQSNLAQAAGRPMGGEPLSDPSSP